MLAILEFIFSSFWTWAGTVVLLYSVVMPFAAVVASTVGRR